MGAIRTHGVRWRAHQQQWMSARICGTQLPMRWLAAVGQAVVFFLAFGERCPTIINADDE